MEGDGNRREDNPPLLLLVTPLAWLFVFHVWEKWVPINVPCTCTSLYRNIKQFGIALCVSKEESTGAHGEERILLLFHLLPLGFGYVKLLFFLSSLFIGYVHIHIYIYIYRHVSGDQLVFIYGYFLWLFIIISVLWICWFQLCYVRVCYLTRNFNRALY